MPSIAGPMTWSDRPQRAGDQPPLALDRKTAFERVAERVRSTRHTLFVVEAPIGYNAYTMLRLAQTISRPGATVLFQPTQTPRTPMPAMMTPPDAEADAGVERAEPPDVTTSTTLPVNPLDVKPTRASLRESHLVDPPSPQPSVSKSEPRSVDK